MNKKNQGLEILLVGLDTFSIETIRTYLQEIGPTFRLSFLNDISEIKGIEKNKIDAVFFYSNRQSQKTIQDIRRISIECPQAAIILLSSRIDYHGLVGSFRAGLFDFLALPIEEVELRTIIYRLQLHEVIQGGQWNPERAVLHLFSRPESFSSIEDISVTLNQYLNLFFNLEKHILYSSEFEMMGDFRAKFKFTPHQEKRIKRFLKDPLGLFFGLRFFKNEFHFLIKTGDEKFSYVVASNLSDFETHDILSDYLNNVLKTSLSILSDSKKREQTRLLSLTDEVTGLFNQRKLLEDLDFHISKYQTQKDHFTLLFIDIDYFKNVNDQYGHVVGSQLLIDMAQVLKKQLRSHDLVYRYGGDEFIVLLPKSNLAESKNIAMRISESVKGADFKIEGSIPYKLSLSIGIAEFPHDGQNAKSMIEFADKMMYLSKKSGRGKVFHISEVVA
jgi:diguanylate cyclase (GGDEF)-like protein